ncbi:hypothetical protein, partial [Streptomyces barkulensis]|uniref:hypothetical protein n=1 Tax=Streptomyces barkulensis TaxID=1257026 RepID=UPI0014032358
MANTEKNFPERAPLPGYPQQAPVHSRARPPRRPLSRVQQALAKVVVAGAVVIAAIGFAGSYAAVRDLAEQ